MSVRRAQHLLAAIWTVGLAVMLVFAIAITVGHQGHGAREIWSWLAPAIFPTFTLIVGVLVQQFRDRAADEPLNDRFLFHLTLGAIVFYFLILGGSFIAGLVIFTKKPLDFLDTSQFWLTPVHAIVTALLGAFFVEKQK